MGFAWVEVMSRLSLPHLSPAAVSLYPVREQLPGGNEHVIRMAESTDQDRFSVTSLEWTAQSHGEIAVSSLGCV